MAVDYQTKITFKIGSNPEYIFPLVQSETGSNLSEKKFMIIEGVRADGCIVIPAGKKSQIITINGIIVGEDYKAITDLMNTMKSAITTDVATLTMKHYEGGNWVTDWSYSVRRLGMIEFSDSLRTSDQPYKIDFIVLVYS